MFNKINLLSITFFLIAITCLAVDVWANGTTKGVSSQVLSQMKGAETNFKDIVSEVLKYCQIASVAIGAILAVTKNTPFALLTSIAVAIAMEIAKYVLL